ncbi:MAG: DUF1080 domain-containing protein [Acidobacteria bacterium]|nr:DUF1080 domain-containing protein [Acidobacteriota bacterium]
MPTRAVLIAFCLAAAISVIPVPAAHGQAGAGWVTLFDGKNLDSFVATGNADWRIADGVLEATKARGFLVSKQSYADFELRGDVWVTTQSNAGFLFRITDPKDPGIENGYELNINDERKDQAGRTGSIVNVAKPLVKFDSGGKWTTVEIRAVGPKMTARLNGTLTAEATDAKYARGPVALQAAGGLVRYRNVQIREVK